MRNELFSRTGVRYEVALDVLGSVIAHYSEQIAKEREKENPDATAIAVAESAKGELRTVREDLDANDGQAIEVVIGRYRGQARSLYQTN